jgi:hypothetical protein
LLRKPSFLRGVGGIFRRTREAKTYFIISKSVVLIRYCDCRGEAFGQLFFGFDQKDDYPNASPLTPYCNCRGEAFGQLFFGFKHKNYYPNASPLI